MATLTVTEITRDGVLYAVAAAAAGGDQFENEGDAFVVVSNASGGAITARAVIQKTVDEVTPDPKEITVADGTAQLFGPFPTDIYNDENGNVQLTYSSATDLSVGVYKL